MISTHHLYWTAGFIDGEGYMQPAPPGLCRSSIGVVATQKDPELLLRLVGLYGGHIYRVPKPDGRAPIHSWRLGGAHAVGLMMTLYPMLSAKRKVEVVRALASWRRFPVDRRQSTIYERQERVRVLLSDGFGEWIKGADKRTRFIIEQLRAGRTHPEIAAVTNVDETRVSQIRLRMIAMYRRGLARPLCIREQPRKKTLLRLIAAGVV